MSKKITSLFLTLAILISVIMPANIAFAEAETATVYLTVSNKGVLASATDGSIMLNRSVSVTDINEDNQLTVEEALIAAHMAYNSEDGFLAPGGYANKLWGINSTNLLFFVNNEGISTSVAEATVENGDNIVASINKDDITYSDWYTFFDAREKTVITDEEFSLNLKGHLGMAFTAEEKVDVPLENLDIGVWKDGVLSAIDGKVTNSSGNITLSFSEAGTYYVSATGTLPTIATDWNLMNMSTAENPCYGVMDFVTNETKMAYTQVDYGAGPYPIDEIKYVDFEIWNNAKENYNTLISNQVITNAPIIAPGCKVVVRDIPSVEIIHNISKSYIESDLTQDIGNLPFIIADLIVYEELYSNSDNKLTDAEKQAYLDILIANAASSSAANVLAKTIIALRALGYDAKNVYTSSLEKIDVVEKLISLMSTSSSSVTNVYTLPYVIMALSQEDNYATDQQLNILIQAALGSKDEWYDTTYGTDGMTPMILALYPFYNTNQNVKTVVDGAIDIIRSKQISNGLLDVPEGFESASAALAIAGLSVYGIDTSTMTNGGDNLINGLMTKANAELDGFDNAFAKEQGLRGLLAHRLLKENKNRGIYDFSHRPLDVGYATWASNCPVTFNVVPGDAVVTIEGATPISKNKFDLAQGTYSYTVSKAGYSLENGNIEITSDDAANHTPKTVNVSLSAISGGGSSQSKDEKKLNVRVKVMTHDENSCNNLYTYKNNSQNYTELVNSAVEIEKGQTVFDALKAVLDKNGIDFIESGYGYISSINNIAEKEHGENSGWMFTVNKEHKTTGSKDTILDDKDVVVWFYTDNYLGETGSEDYVVDNNTPDNEKDEVKEQEPEEEKTFTSETFSDVKEDDWYYQSVKYAYENNLFSGTDNGFEPQSKMTRAMLTTVLFRFDAPDFTSDVNTFLDVTEDTWYSDGIKWAAENKIVSGITKTDFGPNESITREQIAVIIYNYAVYKGYDVSVGEDTNILFYNDYDNISEYAILAMQYLVGAGIIKGRSDTTLNPGDNATRAEVATIMMKFIELNKEA